MLYILLQLFRELHHQHSAFGNSFPRDEHKDWNYPYPDHDPCWCIHTVRTWCTWRWYHPVQRIAKKARIDSIRLILKCCSWWERKVWERVRCWEWGWCDVTHTVHTVHYATHGKIYRTIVIWERYFDLPTHTGRRYFPWCASNVYHVHVLIFLSFPVCCPALPFTPSL